MSLGERTVPLDQHVVFVHTIGVVVVVPVPVRWRPPVSGPLAARVFYAPAATRRLSDFGTVRLQAIDASPVMMAIIFQSRVNTLSCT